MSVIVEQSVCKDCESRSTCMRLKRLNPSNTIRDEMSELYQGVDVGFKSGALLYIRPGRKKEVFEIIISKCSMKEQQGYRKIMREREVISPLYYCNQCQQMHRVTSELGVAHKVYSGG